MGIPMTQTAAEQRFDMPMAWCDVTEKTWKERDRMGQVQRTPWQTDEQPKISARVKLVVCLSESFDSCPGPRQLQHGRNDGLPMSLALGEHHCVLQGWHWSSHATLCHKMGARSIYTETICWGKPSLSFRGPNL